MKKMLFTFETGWLGASWEEEFEFSDDVSETEINEELADWAEDKMRNMEWYWEEV